MRFNSLSSWSDEGTNLNPNIGRVNVFILSNFVQLLVTLTVTCQETSDKSVTRPPPTVISSLKITFTGVSGRMSGAKNLVLDIFESLSDI